VTYTSDDLREIARRVISHNRYMAIGTSTLSGVPWVSPVQFAVDNMDRFYWVSATDALHSKNLESNATVALVIFDSTAQDGQGQGLYCEATAEVITGNILTLGCDIFYKRKYPDPHIREHKGRKPYELSAPYPRRMYRAHVKQYSVLHPDKHPEYGDSVDYRVNIKFTTAAIPLEFSATAR
jgi:nitroimidazol reductase NimA-like FMN-containing flavoprotein (pyridoxamine 5'-phosphate oxidase superfamily)